MKIYPVCFNGKIEKIVPIDGADRINQAWISGWETIIAKDSLNVGDLVVIATEGAVIPYELAESLGITKYLKHKKGTNEYVVRTTKLKGVYSSAVIIAKNDAYEELENTEKAFGVYKYEEPLVDNNVNKTGIKNKNNRVKNLNFEVYYKFPNSKNVPNMFNENDTIEVSRKIHGTNFRAGYLVKNKLSFWDKVKKFFGLLNDSNYYEFVYGSHNVQKIGNILNSGFYDTDVWASIVKKYNLESELQFLYKYLNEFETENVGKGIEVYGELYGPGIQKYYDYGETELKMKVFDIQLDGKYLPTKVVKYYCGLCNLDYVDVLYTGQYNEDIIRSYQNKNYINDTEVPHEGVVVKSIDGNRDKIAKYISPEYLEFQGSKSDSTDFH